MCCDGSCDPCIYYPRFGAMRFYFGEIAHTEKMRQDILEDWDLSGASSFIAFLSSFSASYDTNPSMLFL